MLRIFLLGPFLSPQYSIKSSTIFAKLFTASVQTTIITVNAKQHAPTKMVYKDCHVNHVAAHG